MERVEVDGVGTAFEVVGSGPPWGAHRERFAEHFTTIVPDHRGTGSSDAPPSGYTIAAHAADMAAVVHSVGLGPAHVVGSSTGGAIGQTMAIDHADTVRSLVPVSSWAGPDPYFEHQYLESAELWWLSPITKYFSSGMVIGERLSLGLPIKMLLLEKCV